MNTRTAVILVLSLLGSSAVAEPTPTPTTAGAGAPTAAGASAKQATPSTSPPPSSEGSTPSPPTAPTTATVDRGDILRAVELPRFPGELRRKVFPAEDVDAVVLAGRTAGWPAAEMRELLEASGAIAAEHGGIGSWGQAVRMRIERGERASQIIAVLRAEMASAKGTP